MATTRRAPPTCSASASKPSTTSSRSTAPRMRRLGVRGREALVVTLLTLLVVTTATAIHLSQLSRVVVQEAVKQAELIAKQIYAQTSSALQRTPGADPLVALREDPELRSFLDASVGYSPHLVYALVTDHTGTVLLHTERQKEGKPE